MIKKWLPSLIGLSVFAMLGRLLGFVREMLIASSFGATDVTDSYLTALLLFDIAVAANASFLQGSFAYSTEIKSKAGFNKQIYKLGFKILFIVLFLALLYYPLADYIVPLFYSRSQQANETIINSSKLFFILASFLSASGVFSALLQMKGNITNPGRLVLFLNVLSIAFLLLFGKNMGIISIPLGFLCGGILFFAYQIILIKKDNAAWPDESGISDFRFSGWIIVSFLIFTNALFPSVMGLAERYFAYGFSAGSFSHYQYSQKILQLPYTILSFAISASLLPMQVKSVNEGNEEEFNRATRNGIILSIVTSAFFMIIFFALAGPIVQIIYQRGQFTLLDRAETSSALNLLSMGLIPYLLSPVIANIYFTRKAVKKLVLINLAFVFIQAASLAFFSKQAPGVKALASSWILIGWLNNITLIVYALTKKYFILDRKIIFKLIIIFSAALLTAYFGRTLSENAFAGGNSSLPEIVIKLVLCGAVLSAVYLLMCILVLRRQLTAIIKNRGM